MQNYHSIRVLSCLSFILVLSLLGCLGGSYSILEEKDANMISTLEEVSSKNNSKAEVCRKLPITLGHMELFKVIDYTKRYVAGIDLGYAVYYDLKNNRKGSGNIYVYTRDFGRKEEGLDEKALDELLVEQRDLTRNKAEGGKRR